MRVDASRTLTRTAAGRPVAAGRAGGFADLLAAGGAEPARVAAPVGLVGGIFAQADDGDATNRRSRGLARGHDMLDGLEALRRDMLVGRVDPGRLQRFSAELDDDLAAGDPALAAILAEIRLRIAVERAKIEMSHNDACSAPARPL
jgi:hypothetical protein